MIHQPLPPDGVHPQINSSQRLLVFCLVRLDFFVIYYGWFIFPQCFIYNLYLKSFDSHISASFNLGRSENGEIGNGLTLSSDYSRPKKKGREAWKRGREEEAH